MKNTPSLAEASDINIEIFIENNLMNKQLLSGNIISNSDIFSEIEDFSLLQKIKLIELLEKELLKNDTLLENIIKNLILLTWTSILTRTSDGFIDYLVATNPNIVGEIRDFKVTNINEREISVRLKNKNIFSFNVTLEMLKNTYKQVGEKGNTKEIATTILNTNNTTQRIIEIGNEIEEQKNYDIISRNNLCDIEEQQEIALFKTRQQKALAFSDLGILKEEGWTMEKLEDEIGIKVIAPDGNTLFKVYRFVVSKDGKYAGIIFLNDNKKIFINEIGTNKAWFFLEINDGEINTETLENFVIKNNCISMLYKK